jgi:hypothetical protein
MVARLTGGTFESSLVREVLARKLSAENLATVTGLHPSGTFAADVDVRPGPQRWRARSRPTALFAATVEARPRF